MRRTTVMPQSGCTPTMRFIMALLSSVPLFELRGLLERQLAWPCTLENPIDHQRGAPQHVAIVRTLGHQPPTSTKSRNSNIAVTRCVRPDVRCGRDEKRTSDLERRRVHRRPRGSYW